MTVVRGVDGCRAGWVVITRDTATGALSWQVCADAAELIDARPRAQVTAIDIPIGLPDSGPRACDRAARQLLGPGRGSSVFPAPLRPMLAAASYAEACRVGFALAGKRLSVQAWNIVPKIREVDAVLRAEPRLQRRVREVHPELSFQILARRPLAHGKKTAAGQAERLALLRPIYGARVEQALADRRALGSAADDVLDAFAALWTAERLAANTALTLPATPVRDAHGLRMEIVA